MTAPAYVIIILFAALILVPLFGSGRYKKKYMENIKDSFGEKPAHTDYELKSIESYHEYVEAYTDTSKHVDAITWNDLDMDQVYKRINTCLTSVGEEYLYNALHEINFNEDKLNKREELIAFFEENPETRLEVQTILSLLGKSDFNGLSSCIFDAKSKILERSWVYYVLTFLPLLFAGFIFLSTAPGIVLTILSMVANAIIYYRMKLKLDKELAVIGYFSALLWSADKMCKIRDDKLKGFLYDLRKNFDVFKSLKGKMSRMMQKSMGPLSFIPEYYRMVFFADIRRYNRVIGKIYKESESFHSLFRNFGELDMAICVLSFRKSMKNFCRPSFADGHSVEFKGIYHPLLDDAVTNDGKIARHSLVTGPNASGKSTFIKAVAVNSILAQTISTCAAEEYTIKHSLIMTSMAVRDNILAGDSYFITEIKSLKRVLDKIEKVPCTCFIDEILRGTNTIERIAASSAILKYLVGRDCLCMAASHDIELTRIMEGIYDNYHFSEKVESDGVSFDFKLKNGAANTKNAIRLLGFMGYDGKIVEAAEKNVEEFIKTGSWSKISSKKS